MASIQTIIQSDPERMKILNAVASLNLPDWYIAAGFVRNMVWDYLHGFETTPYNDVDIIYFDKNAATSPEFVREQLHELMPDVCWEAKNQALKNAEGREELFDNIEDSMCYWPEKETAVGVRLSSSGEIEVATPFGTESLFSGLITYNPNGSKSKFENRVSSKKWLEKWPKLRLAK